MSTITLIISRQGMLTVHEVPIRDCVRLFESGLANLPRRMQAWRSRRHLDAGYILVDYDDNLIVSNQGGFASSHLTDQARNALIRSWDFIERY